MLIKGAAIPHDLIMSEIWSNESLSIILHVPSI